MKKNKVLKVVIIIVVSLIVVFTSVALCYVPMFNNLKNVEQISNKFNENVSALNLVGNSISTSDINSCKTKFNNAQKDIFSDSSTSIEYQKLVQLKDSIYTDISLTYSEYSFLLNALKNNNTFLVENNIDVNVQNASVVGYEKTIYYERFLFKVNIESVIKKMKPLDFLKNNLYLLVTKSGNVYSYQINELNESENEIIEAFLNEYFKTTENFKKFTIESLSKFLLDEYMDLSLTFKNYINININL